MFVNVLKRETGERRFILFSVLLLISGLFFLHVQAAGEQAEKFVPKLSIRQEFNAPENVNVPVDSTFQYQLEGVTGTEPLPGGAQGSYVFSLQGNDSRDFFFRAGDAADSSLIRYDARGVYEYRIRPLEKNRSGYQVDMEEYDIQVFIKDGESGSEFYGIVVRDSTGKKPGEIVYRQSLLVESDPTVSPDPEGENPTALSSDQNRTGTGAAGNVKTGDDTPVMTWIILLLLSFVGIGIYGGKHRYG